MKKTISFAMCAVMALTFSACGGSVNDKPLNSSSVSGSSSSNTNGGNVEFALTAAKTVSDFKDSQNVVICWGDSITKGHTLGVGWSYPEQLQADVGNQFRVINAGVNGESTVTIMSRANAIDTVVAKDIVFNAGQSTVVLDRSLFVAADGSEIIYKGDGNGLKMSTVKLGDAEYTMTVEDGTEWDNKRYCLTRADSSAALTVKRGTKVQFDYTSQYGRNYCNIILSGANDQIKNEEDLLTLIEKQKKIAALSDKYIVIVPFHSSNDYSAAYEAAFGKNALSVREYFQTDAFADYNVEKTTADERTVKQSNWIPPTFTMTRQDVHLNELGCKVLADKVYQKGIELGYWS